MFAVKKFFPLLLSACCLSTAVLFSAPIRSSIGASEEAWIPADEFVNPYVADSMVAMWDGVWNTGLGEYDPDATTWKDLVGERDLELSGTSAFVNGRFVTDGSSGCYAINYNPIPRDQVVTIEMVAQLRYVQAPSFHFSCGDTRADGDRTGVIAYLSGLHLSFNCDTGADASIAANEKVVRSVVVVYNPVATYDSAVVAAYVNGQEVAMTRANRGNRNPQGNAVIVGGTTWNYNAADTFCRIAVHSRALTPEEIQYNYQIDKARFGL